MVQTISSIDSNLILDILEQIIFKKSTLFQKFDLLILLNYYVVGNFHAKKSIVINALHEFTLLSRNAVHNIKI